MDNESRSFEQYRQEIVMPETFFPSEPLNYAFRQFLWHYCQRIHGVKVVLDRNRPLLEVRVRVNDAVRRVVVMLYSDAAGVMVKASTVTGDRNCPGVMHLLLLLSEEPQNLRYRVELDNNFAARFYTEMRTDQLRNSGDFHDLIIRLAETATRLEQMDP